MADVTGAAAPAGAATAQDKPGISAGYVRYALWLLLIIYIFNFLDRQIVNILGPEIQKELGINDTQLGMLTGLAFALLYTVLGIPVARFADRPTANRPLLISAALAVWSGMTALCGTAQNFTQLLLARMGVGIGEAGCTPPAHSLISDYVPRERRASALAFYGLGVPVGSLLGMVLGGQLADLYGWRAAFLIVGVPGVALAIVAALTLREPRLRQALEVKTASPAAPQTSLKEAFQEVGKSRAFVLLAAAAALVAFLGYGKAVWAVVLFTRIHGLSAGDVGLWLGIVAGVAGVVGMWFGGFAADRWGKKQARHYLTAPAWGMILTAPLLTAAYLSTDWRLALVLLFVPTVANNLYYGPTFACVQSLVRPQTRALAAAIMLFVINLVGLGLGPTLFGALSDALKPVAGVQSVRWVLVAAATLGVIPGLLFWLASRRLEAELRKE